MSQVEQQRPASHKGVGDIAVVESDWPRDLCVTVWSLNEVGDERYSALCEEFNIAGAGPTVEAAFADMESLLVDYLQCCRAENLPWAQVLHPVPLQRRLRMHLELRANRLVQRVRRGRISVDRARLDEHGLHAA